MYEDVPERVQLGLHPYEGDTPMEGILITVVVILAIVWLIRHL